MMEQRYPLPPFDMESATLKVRRAEDAWNGRDPAAVARAHTFDSRSRNRIEFINGSTKIVAFLTRNSCASTVDAAGPVIDAAADEGVWR